MNKKQLARLEVGDRVAIYDWWCFLDKESRTVHLVKGINGDWLTLQHKPMTQINYRQCVPLKKKVKRIAREWWLVKDQGECLTTRDSLEKAKEIKDRWDQINPPNEIVHVREVLDSKG